MAVPAGVQNTGGFPRIDSHQHFTREYLPSLLFPILKRNRFDGTVVVTKIPSVEESRWLLGLAGEHAFIRGVVCWVELSDAHVGEVLDEYQRHSKFRGVCVGQALSPANFACEAELPAGLAELARRDLTLDLPPNFEIAAGIAGKFPSLRIAIDHIGRPSLMEGRQTAELAQLARYPNVFVKISGLITDAPTARTARPANAWARR